MGKTDVEVINAYAQSVVDTVADAYNEGYQLGLKAAKQIYK